MPYPFMRSIYRTMTLAYDIATAAVATIMTGNEFAVAAFVHPQLYHLNDTAHAQTAALLARVLGKAMPPWYGIALALIAGAAIEHRPISSGSGLLLAAAAVLWAATIVFTVAALVPINNRIAQLNPVRPYNGWRADRTRWDRLHRIRVVLLIVSVLLLFTALLQKK
jgi:hypothetical protein